MKNLITLASLFFSLQIFADQQSIVTSIELDDVSKIRRLVESGQLSVDEKIKNDMPILMIAARAGSEKVSQYLISKKANVNALNSVNETALMMAVFFEKEENEGGYASHDRIARLLIAAGANLENGNWWAPLAYSAYKGRIEIAQYMVSLGALVDGPVVNGVASVNTPLMMASMQGHAAFVKFLLMMNANPKLLNTRNVTALELAKKYNQKHVFKYLECANYLAPGELYKDKCGGI